MQTEKTILAIVPWLEVGGADQFNINLLNGLKACGWKCVILTTKKGTHPLEPLFKEITPYIHHANENYGDAKFIIDGLFDEITPSVVFISNSIMGYHLIPHIKSNFTVPIVDYVHCEDLNWFNGGFPNFSAQYSGLLDKTFVSSEQLKSFCIEIGHISEKICVQYINIDANKIYRSTPTRDRIKKELKLNEETIVILFAARLTVQKQPWILIKTLEILKDRNLPFRCIIIGDGPEKKRLHKEINKSKVGKFVHYFGQKSNAETLEFMDACDIFFLPSLYEGIALTFFEAMSKELVVVGANVGGQKELVIKDTGFLVEVEHERQQIYDYANILEHLIRSPQLIKEMGGRGRERILGNFMIDTLINNMHNSLSEIKHNKFTAGELLKPYNFILEVLLQNEQQFMEAVEISSSFYVKKFVSFKKRLRQLIK